MTELFVGPRSLAQRDAHWRYARGAACAVWGIRPEALPEGWAPFERWYFRTCGMVGHTLHVTPCARSMGEALLKPPHWEQRWLDCVGGVGSMRLATAVLMPRPLRRGFGLRAGRFEHAVAIVLCALVRMLYALQPGSVRYLTQYHEWKLRSEAVREAGEVAGAGAGAGVGADRRPGGGSGSAIDDAAAAAPAPGAAVAAGPGGARGRAPPAKEEGRPSPPRRQLSRVNKLAARWAKGFVDAYLDSIGSRMKM